MWWLQRRCCRLGCGYERDVRRGRHRDDGLVSPTRRLVSPKPPCYRAFWGKRFNRRGKRAWSRDCRISGAHAGSHRMTTWMRPIRRLTAVALATLCLAAQAGEITAYTSLEEDDVKVYLDGFGKAKPGIKVNVLRLSTGDLAARMLAEKSNPRHDVIW